MARTAHRRLTYDDLRALPEDGLRHEHLVFVAREHLALDRFIELHDSGELFYAGLLTESNIQGAPDLVVALRRRLFARQRRRARATVNLREIRWCRSVGAGAT